jgi:hypothetical protein
MKINDLTTLTAGFNKHRIMPARASKTTPHSAESHSPCISVGLVFHISSEALSNRTLAAEPHGLLSPSYVELLV